MTFSLSTTDFMFLKKYMSYAYELIKCIKEYDSSVEFDIDDIGEFQLEMNDSIVTIGMDNDDTVNENGIRIYHIYDTLLYQIGNKQ